MALLLMMLARKLRPNYAPLINDRIQYYREHRSAPESSETLKFVARDDNILNGPATDVILEALGADYFIFSAQLVERESPEMALLLMLLAGQLRLDAPFISERILHYREKLGKLSSGAICGLN